MAGFSFGVEQLGAACFGAVVGWITYRTLRRKQGSTGVSDIATVIGAVGGAAVTALFEEAVLFGWYSIGLGIGFFGYFVASLLVGGKKELNGWMGE